MNALVEKYNTSGPRYTSYPTVPFWNTDQFKKQDWIVQSKKYFDQTNTSQGISLYIHLPFCESLCTFCGCHKKITKQHSVEEAYINALLKEWALYRKLLTEKPIITEIHLGGGTPTFFSPKNLSLLINGILKEAIVSQTHEFSFEGHPNNTTKEHLQILFDLGFRRVSFGVQDYSPTIQKAINRIQPFKNVAQVSLWAREIGYNSMSNDLIYGLPFQKKEDIIDTIEKTLVIKPNRIAFYSYAHVPWIKGNGQRGFKDDDIPNGSEKLELYLTGKELLINNGYKEIAMDHFALENDSLYTSYKAGKLHRNFMGYTSSKTKVMIGLGVSSISDCWGIFAQNEKNLDAYYKLIDKDELPIIKGHLLSSNDLIVRKHILNLMCTFKTSWKKSKDKLDNISEIKQNLIEFEKDELIISNEFGFSVTKKGKPYVRNICMVFDAYLNQSEKVESQLLFSKTI